MACVLTVAVVGDHAATIGMSATRGSTSSAATASRKSRATTRRSANARTPARFPDRRDAAPAASEVYRDVGSEPHEQTDPEFIDLYEIAFEPDAALLLCSDGLPIWSSRRPSIRS
jgi:hypothetical protein